MTTASRGWQSHSLPHHSSSECSCARGKTVLLMPAVQCDEAHCSRVAGRYLGPTDLNQASLGKEEGMKFLAKGMAAVTVGMLLAAPSLKAQGVEFGLGGGVGVPLGDFDDESKLGWHGLAELSFVPNGWPVGIQFDGSYQQFGLENSSAPAGFSDLKTRLVMGTGNIVFKFKSSDQSTFRPYLIGGAGVYNSKVTGQDDPGDVLGGG